MTLKLQAETLFDAEAAEDARFDGDVETLKKTIAVAAVKRPAEGYVPGPGGTVPFGK